MMSKESKEARQAKKAKKAKKLAGFTTPYTFKQDMQLYRRLLAFVWPHKWVFLIALIGMSMVSASDMWFIRLLQPIIDEGFVNKTPIDGILIFCLFLAVVMAVGNFIDGYCMAWVAQTVVQNLRNLMFEKLMYAPVAYYDQHASGRLGGRLVNDVEQVADSCTSVIRMLFKDSIKVVLFLGLMFSISWELTLLFLTVVPVFYLVFKLSSKKFRILSRRLQENFARILHVSKEALQGQRVVKIFGAYEYQYHIFARTNKRNRQLRLKGSLITSITSSVLLFISMVAILSVVKLFVQLEISIGGFASYFTAMNRVRNPVRNLAGINLAIQSGLAGAESVFKVIDLQSEPDRGKIALKRAKGDIKFDKVSFAYQKDKKAAKIFYEKTLKNPPRIALGATVLHDVSVDIKAGSTVALVGASGSGKSTLASLLLRFYLPQSGSISIDGHPLDSVTLKSLRANYAIVSQEITLFDDTIGHNIAYSAGGDISQKRLIEAATAANIMEFIETTPFGMKTLIGEHGVLLSGGQRQRIAIARALYKDAPILIMDEATSSLDTHSEQLIHAATTRLTKDRTALIIAHRLSTIENADKILVLDKGRVVEQGDHETLLRKDGVYARLHKAQYRKVKAA